MLEVTVSSADHLDPAEQCGLDQGVIPRVVGNMQSRDGRQRHEKCCRFNVRDELRDRGIWLSSQQLSDVRPRQHVRQFPN